MQHHKITIIQLMLVILSPSSTSKASKKEGNVFFHVYKRFLFRIKKRVFNVFIFFLTFIKLWEIHFREIYLPYEMVKIIR